MCTISMRPRVAVHAGVGFYRIFPVFGAFCSSPPPCFCAFCSSFPPFFCAFCSVLETIIQYVSIENNHGYDGMSMKLFEYYDTTQYDAITVFNSGVDVTLCCHIDKLSYISSARDSVRLTHAFAPSFVWPYTRTLSNNLGFLPCSGHRFKSRKTLVALLYFLSFFLCLNV